MGALCLGYGLVQAVVSDDPSQLPMIQDVNDDLLRSFALPLAAVLAAALQLAEGAGDEAADVALTQRTWIVRCSHVTLTPPPRRSARGAIRPPRSPPTPEKSPVSADGQGDGPEAERPFNLRAGMPGIGATGSDEHLRRRRFGPVSPDTRPGVGKPRQALECPSRARMAALTMIVTPTSRARSSMLNRGW